jgi:hypothetical protein
VCEVVVEVDEPVPSWWRPRRESVLEVAVVVEDVAVELVAVDADEVWVLELLVVTVELEEPPPPPQPDTPRASAAQVVAIATSDLQRIHSV